MNTTSESSEDGRLKRFEQEQGIDYWNTFNFVASYVPIRQISSLAASHKMELPNDIWLIDLMKDYLFVWWPKGRNLCVTARRLLRWYKSQTE